MRKHIVGLAGAAILCAFQAHAEYVGEYPVGTDNICKIFNTYRPSTGAAFAIANEEVDVFKDDNTAQDDDSGLTIDDDFDGLTGAHQVCVDTSSDGTFYSAGSIFTVVISVGTVDSVSVVGTEVMTFSLAKGPLSAGALTATVVANNAIDAATFAADVDAEVLSYIVDDATRIDASELNADVDSLTFTVAGDVDANAQGISGDTTAADNLEAILDLITNTGNGAFPPFGISASGTAQSYTAGTPDFVLASSTAAADNDFNGQLLTAWGDEGELQAACIDDYTGATDTAILLAAFNTNMTGTIRYVIYPTLSCEASGSSLTAADVWANATRTLTALDEDTTTLDLNATTVGAVAVLDEDSTTIDLNASFVGGVTVFDEDTTTIDINATTLGTVTTATAVTTVNGLANNVLTAASADPGLTAELQAGLATAAALAAVDTDVRDVVIEDQGGTVSLGCAIAAILAYAAGDVETTGSDSVYEESSGTETRIEGTVAAAGDRVATITCPTY